MMRACFPIRTLILAGTIVAGGNLAIAQPLQLAGTTCVRPPALHCPDAECPG